MAQLDRTQLKAKFENGDIPTQADFADLIDSLALKSEIGGGSLDINPITRTYSVDGLEQYLLFNTDHDMGTLGGLTHTNDDPSFHSHNGYFTAGQSIFKPLDTVSGSVQYANTSKDITIPSISGSKSRIISDTVSTYDDTDEGISYSVNQNFKRLKDLFPITVSGNNPSLLYTCEYPKYPGWNIAFKPVTDTNYKLAIEPSSYNRGCVYYITAPNFNHDITINYMEIYLVFPNMSRESETSESEWTGYTYSLYVLAMDNESAWMNHGVPDNPINISSGQFKIPFILTENQSTLIDSIDSYDAENGNDWRANFIEVNFYIRGTVNGVEIDNNFNETISNMMQDGGTMWDKYLYYDNELDISGWLNNQL